MQEPLPLSTARATQTPRDFMHIYDASFDLAMQFASKKHAQQTRKLPKVDPPPYISHPATLALLLARSNWPAHVLTAAILHDVVEDTDTTLDELRALFGEQVATLVAYVTEASKDHPWEERKRAYIDTLRHHAPPEALAIASADKIHNLRSLHNEIQRQHREAISGRSAVWDAFSRGRERSLWFYNEVLSVLRERSLEDARLGPLYDELSTTLALFEE